MIDSATLAALLVRGRVSMEMGPPALVTTYELGTPRHYPGKDIGEALRRALAATTKEGSR